MVKAHAFGSPVYCLLHSLICTHPHVGWHAVCEGFCVVGRSAKHWPVMTILESWKTLPEEFIVFLQLLGRQQMCIMHCYVSYEYMTCQTTARFDSLLCCAGALVELRDERLILLSRLSFYAQCRIKLQVSEGRIRVLVRSGQACVKMHT